MVPKGPGYPNCTERSKVYNGYLNVQGILWAHNVSKMYLKVHKGYLKIPGIQSSPDDLWYLKNIVSPKNITNWNVGCQMIQTISQINPSLVGEICVLAPRRLSPHAPLERIMCRLRLRTPTCPQYDNYVYLETKPKRAL